MLATVVVSKGSTSVNIFGKMEENYEFKHLIVLFHTLSFTSHFTSTLRSGHLMLRKMFTLHHLTYEFNKTPSIKSNYNTTKRKQTRG